MNSHNVLKIINFTMNVYLIEVAIWETCDSSVQEIDSMVNKNTKLALSEKSKIKDMKTFV